MSRLLPFLLAGSLLLALLAVAPASAGSATAPEISDPDKDQKLIANGQSTDVPLDTLGAAKGADLRAVWIDNETASNVTVHIKANANIGPGLVSQLTPTASYTYSLVAKAGLRDVAASATVAVAPNPTGAPNVIVPANSAGGSAKNVSVVDGVLQFQIPRSALDNATAGTKLANITVTATGFLFGSGNLPFVIRDTAGPGNYTFTKDTVGHETVPGTGGGPKNPDGAPGCTYRATEANRTDEDADCLPDHWERDYFPTLAQDGTGDPDGDGCNNRCEYLHGTDPTKKDTDGDGTSDGDEVKAGTDPTNPNSKPAATTTTTTTSPPTTTSTTTTGAGTTTTGATTSEPTDDSFLGKIEADAGYAVASGAAMGAVVLISLIGLFGRWGA